MSKLSKGIRILGWITILSSGFGLIAFLVSTYALPHLTTGLSVLGEEASKLNKELVVHNRAWTPLFVIEGLLHLWVGIALLKGRGWARAFICYQTAIGILLAQPLFITQLTHRGFHWSIVLMQLLMLTWSVFILYYLNRSAMKIQFTPVTARLRFTIASLVLVFGGMFLIQGRRQAMLAEQLSDVLKARVASLEQSLGPRMTLGKALNTRKMMNLLSESSNLSKQGKLQEATETTGKALEATQKAFGGDSVMTAAMLNLQAQNYEALGQTDQAIAVLERAVATWEKQKDSGNVLPDYEVVGGTASTMEQLAELYERKGQYAQATALLEKALPLWEKVANWPSKTHAIDQRQVARTYNRLGYLYRLQEKYTEAEMNLKQAIALHQKIAGKPDDAEVAAVLMDQAYLYVAQQRYTEAESLYQQALGMNERLYGADHLAVSSVLEALGHMYHEQHRYAEAEALLTRALTIRQPREPNGQITKLIAQELEAVRQAKIHEHSAPAAAPQEQSPQ